MQLHLADLRNLLAEHDCGGMTLENCWTGFGIGSGSDRAREVVDEVLNGPLFADGQAWSKGSAVIACLGGGKNLSMGEFQTVIEYLKQEIPVELPILAGTILEPYETDSLSLTLMVVGQTFAEEEAPRVKAKEEFAFGPAPATAVETKRAEPPVKSQVVEEPEIPAAEPPTMGKAVGNAADFFGTADESDNKGTEQKYFVQQEELPLDKKIYRGRFEKSAPTILNGEDLDQPTFMRQNVKIRL
jgi:cell division protein FtsZ